MSAYRFDVSCPRCAGPLEHVNGANPDGGLSHAIAACVPCRKQYHLRLELMLLGEHR